MLLTTTKTGGYEATKMHGHRALANWSTDPTEAPTNQGTDQGRHRPTEASINQGTDWPRHSLRRTPTDDAKLNTKTQRRVQNEDTVQGAARRHSAEEVLSPFSFPRLHRTVSKSIIGTWHTNMLK